jgi:hypothetical protein
LVREDGYLEGFARRCIAITALITSLFLGGSAPESSEAESNVMLVPAAGPAGTETSVLGRGFGARHTVAVRVGRRVVARARTSRRGSFRSTFRIDRARLGRIRVVSRSGGRRVVNLFRVSTAARAVPSEGEVASRRGMRMRWTPTESTGGSTVHLKGAHFPRMRWARIRVGGREMARTRTDRTGWFSTRFTVPAVAAKRRLVRVKLRSRALAFLFTLIPPPASAPAAAGHGDPAPGPASVVYAAGDIACAPGDSVTSTACHQAETSDIIVNGGASSVLALGDLQYNSASLSNLRASYDRSWGRVKSITRPVIGNHEGSGTGYFDYFNGSGVNNGPAGERGKGYYSYDVGSWHLIALNSNCSRVPCSAGSAQEQWLHADLAANPRTCTLAYWHHPRFSSGHDGDGTFMQYIWRALYEANADLVLVGHSHNYERFAPMNASGALDRARGMREFVVGTGGAFFTGISSAKPNSEVRQNNTFGVLKVILRPASYEWKFVPEAGKGFTDSGAEPCH